METKPRTMFNSALIYGLFTGIAYIGLALVMYIGDMDPKNPIAYVGFVILIGGIYWGTVQYRNKSLNGYISYGQAFLTGLLIAVIATVISSVYTYAFYTFFDPAAHTKMVEMGIEKARESMMDKGMSDEQIESGLNISRSFMSPMAMALMSLLFNTLIGGVISLITAAIIKKEDKSFEGQFKEN
jgi:hypothetical protein